MRREEKIKNDETGRITRGRKWRREVEELQTTKRQREEEESEREKGNRGMRKSTRREIRREG